MDAAKDMFPSSSDNFKKHVTNIVPRDLANEAKSYVDELRSAASDFSAITAMAMDYDKSNCINQSFIQDCVHDIGQIVEAAELMEELIKFYEENH